MTISYVVNWNNGNHEHAPTYDAAIAIVRRDYPEAAIGHDGDLTDGGDRTLCWPDEAVSANDAGLHACASIHRVERT